MMKIALVASALVAAISTSALAQTAVIENSNAASAETTADKILSLQTQIDIIDLKLKTRKENFQAFRYDRDTAAAFESGDNHVVQTSSGYGLARKPSPGTYQAHTASAPQERELRRLRASLTRQLSSLTADK